MHNVKERKLIIHQYTVTHEQTLQYGSHFLIRSKVAGAWWGRRRRCGESWNSSGRRRWGMNSTLLCFGYHLYRRSYGCESTRIASVAIRAGRQGFRRARTRTMGGDGVGPTGRPLGSRSWRLKQWKTKRSHWRWSEERRRCGDEER
jgi:hypothetical protein